MTGSLHLTSISPQPHLISAGQPRLLIVSDSTEGLTKLRAALEVGEIEVMSAASSAELGLACRVAHHLVVIDVGPDQLVEVLRKLRASHGHTGIPVLVEASRIAPDQGIAGVLLQYRAMPCCFDDLIVL